jgi:hypothetical protein
MAYRIGLEINGGRNWRLAVQDDYKSGYEKVGQYFNYSKKIFFLIRRRNYCVPYFAR